MNTFYKLHYHKLGKYVTGTPASMGRTSCVLYYDLCDIEFKL